MSNQAANRTDFERLQPGIQIGILAVLETCMDNRLSVRCEVLGRDINLIIGKGYSSPNYWREMFLDAP